MATRRWLGTAQNIAQVDTITAALTWATGDTASITIGAVTITVTVGTAAATTNVVAAMTAAVNGAALVGDETRNTTGDLHPEFSWITASTSGSTCILTADVAGRPFTATVASVTAGTGTWVLANTTAATGKNYWTNADNWSGGAVPINNDVIVFDTGSVSCLYGIDQSATVYTGSVLRVEASYTGQIGLSETNSDVVGSAYSEYRDTYLDSDWASVIIGEGTGAGSSLLRIGCDGASTTVNIFKTAATTETGKAACIVTNINGGTVNCFDGDIGIDQVKGQTSADVDVNVGYDDSVTGDVTLVGYDDSVTGDVTLFVGAGSSVGTVTCYGGTNNIYGATGITTLNHKAGNTTLFTPPIATATFDGGTITLVGSTQFAGTTWTVGGTATLDASRALGGVSITNPIEVHGQNCSISDPSFNFAASSVFDLNHSAKVDQLDFGPDVRITVAATA
jgi:hypothetical protein